MPLIGVVKGNGYGFGIKELTSVLLQHGIKTFAVTEVTDIPELKELLLDEDILVMRSTCLENEAEIIAENGAIATIGSLRAAQVMNAVSRSSELSQNVISKLIPVWADMALCRRRLLTPLNVIRSRI